MRRALDSIFDFPFFAFFVRVFLYFLRDPPIEAPDPAEEEGPEAEGPEAEGPEAEGPESEGNNIAVRRVNIVSSFGICFTIIVVTLKCSCMNIINDINKIKERI